MSLTVNENSASSIAPISEGTHLAFCVWLIDLGVQYNETFKNSSRKVMLGWEIPDEQIDTEDGTKNRTITMRYTASLNENSNLRRDLSAWRGRDFTEDELEEFNLRNIVGKPCLLNIIHKTKNGKTYANIQSVAAVPKIMKDAVQAATRTAETIVFDLDESTVEEVDQLPTWIAEVVKKSLTYKEKLDLMYQEQLAPVTGKNLTELEDDGDLPF